MKKIKVFNCVWKCNYKKVTDLLLYRPDNKGLSWCSGMCIAKKIGGTGEYQCFVGTVHFDRLPLEIKQEIIKASASIDDIATIDLKKWKIEIDTR